MRIPDAVMTAALISMAISCGQKVVADQPSGLAPMQQVQFVESMWTNDPQGYFKKVAETFTSMARSNPSPEHKQAAWTAFTNALHHPIPTNDPVLARTCLGAKLSIMQIYSGEPLHARQLEEAGFLGEIRMLRDTNYVARYGKFAGAHSTASFGRNAGEQAAFSAEEEEYRLKRAEFLRVDALQRELSLQDRLLYMSLRDTVPTFRGTVPDYTNYVHQISVAAHLTEDEQNRLLGISSP